MIPYLGMKTLRVYVDTSVVGGCFDEPFQEASRALFRMVKEGKLRAVVSSLLIEELTEAPPEVQKVLTELSSEGLEQVRVDEEAIELRDAYLAADVVGPARANDALHVALATVARADVIVSWNFKHIVHFDKIRGFNAVNLRQGYLPIEIRTPLEIV
jgi:predicted nucleic acid-binding protein